MTESLKPYIAYEDSGVPWLGEMPEHWGVRQNGRLFAQRNDLDSPELPILEVSLKTGVRVRDFGGASRKQVMTDRSKYKRARRGDIAYNMMRMWQGAVGVAPVDGLVSPAYVVARPLSGTNSKYCSALFRTPAYMAEVNNYSRGIVSDRNRLYWEDFKQIPTPFPPAEEQSAIVRFLAHAERRIRRLIRAKQKLIALLEEQKQAIIHRAVTRGLDPSVRLKPSGIEWLGDVPEHWEVRRLRFCIRGKLTYGANATAEFTNPIWPRYLRITDFGGDGALRPDTFRSLPPAIAKDYLVEDGDILFARSGATVGKAFLVRAATAKACYAGYLIRACPNTNVVLSTFLFAFTQSAAFLRWKEAAFSRATIQNIGADKYADLAVPIPPIAEQHMILDSIEIALAPIRTSIARFEREISLLREFRTRLVSDVVTGKLDVRQAAADLPDEEDETDETATIEDDAEIETVDEGGDRG